MNTELEEKTERITAMLQRESLAAVLLNTQHNFAWLTAGCFNGIDTSRENGAATLLITCEGRRFVLANNIEMRRMLAEVVQASEFDPIEYPWQSEKVSGGFLIEKAREVVGKKDLGIDVALSPDARVIERPVSGCRYRLTESEVQRFRALGRDAGTAVRKVIDTVRPGETEIEIAEKLRHELAVGEMSSAVTLVAADDRINQFRHPVPTTNRWHKTLLIVTCAKRHGLIVSLSRMICVGDVSDDLKTQTEAAAYVNAKILDATTDGETGAEIYRTAKLAYAESGFADEIDLHHQGGATGYRTRDWVAHPASDDIVAVNQAFAWNPSITGTKVEETCIVTEGGIEMITTSPDFPFIMNVVNGREYLSPGILTI
ncbi:MAG: M24 family metallopeptidase [Pyrinomonadaceae bacterium]